MKQYFGIDVGGTEVKWAIMDEDFNFVGDRGSIKTDFSSAEEAVEAFASLVEPYRDQVVAIGMSVPGSVMEDDPDGTIHRGGALTYMDQCPLAKLMRERFGMPVAVNNDGKCAGLGEYAAGALKGTRFGVTIGIGTGIAGGIVIDGKANDYEYSIDGTTWVKAYKGENTVTGLTPSEHYTISFRMNDSNYAEGGVTVYPLSVQLPVDTTTNVDEILAQAQELADSFSSTGFGRYVELMDDLNSVSVADREARAEEIEEALAAIEEARSEYMADLQAAIDSAVDTAEKATGKGIGVSAVGMAAVVGGAAMPAALGIGFIFAAARKRKSKEEDLND